MRSPFGDDVRLFVANTNVIGHAGRTFARVFVEAGTPPVELTDELDTIGPSDFDGTREHPYTAHPKLDPATGELPLDERLLGVGEPGPLRGRRCGWTGPHRV